MAVITRNTRTLSHQVCHHGGRIINGNSEILLQYPYLFFPFTGAQPQRQPPYDQFVFNLRASYRQETEATVENFLRIGRKRPCFGILSPSGRGGALPVSDSGCVSRGKAKLMADLADTATALEVLGETSVTGVRIRNVKTGP